MSRRSWYLLVPEGERKCGQQHKLSCCDIVHINKILDDLEYERMVFAGDIADKSPCNRPYNDDHN